MVNPCLPRENASLSELNWLRCRFLYVSSDLTVRGRTMRGFDAFASSQVVVEFVSCILTTADAMIAQEYTSNQKEYRTTMRR